MDIELPNISNYTVESDLFYIFCAILTVDVVVLFLARYFTVGGKYLNEWYDNYHILAVISDVMIILIGFIIARYIYTTFFFDKFGWNVVYFLILLVVIQVLHDILFYVGVIRTIPKGENILILSGSTNYCSLLKKDYNVLYNTKNNNGNNIDSICDLVTGSLCKKVFIGNFNFDKKRGSTFSYILSKLMNNEKSYFIDLDEL